MQIAARSTIVGIVLFLLGLAGAGYWLEQDFRDASREAMAETAELIARQISAALYEPVVDRVLERDTEAFTQLNETVAATIDRSDTIIRLIAVGANGEHLAGGEEGSAYPPLKAVFGDPPQTQVSSEYTSRFTLGRHIALVPITRVGKPVAYLRIELSNRRIHQVYDRLAGRLVNFALVGVAAILVLGGLLHFELSRIGREIIGLMKTGVNTESGKQRFGKDEFHDLRYQAMQLGSEASSNTNALGVLSNVLQLGLILFDSAGNPRFVSDSARSMLGLSGDTNLKTGLEASLGKAKEDFKRAINTLLKGEANTAAAGILVEPTETGRTLKFELVSTSHDGGPVLALIRDQEQVTALQSSLQAATRMHSLSTIFAGAAHDLRAPISAMVMNLELLEDTMGDGDRPLTESERDEQRRYVQILQEELNRLQRFLTSFLDSATMMRYRGSESVELKAILEELIRLFRVRARQSDVTVVTEFSQQEFWIDASSDQIRQLFMNIIVNALEAMPDGGTLTLTATQEDNFVVVGLRDTGQGVPSRVRDELFDLHFTTKSHGTGIGLHVARTIATQHSGTIDVKSKLGEGSEFIVKLPAAANEPARAVA